MGRNQVCSILHPLHAATDTGYSESMCVRVTGSLKTFGQKRYLNATHIRASQDPHEIYFHILESIAVTLMIDRGPVCWTNECSFHVCLLSC